MRRARQLWLVISWLALSGWLGCGSTGDVSHPQPDFPLVEAETVEVAYDGEDLAAARALDEEALEDGEPGQVEQGLVGEPARTLRPLREALLGTNNLLRSGLVQLRRVAEEGEFLGGDGDVGRWRLDGARNRFTLTIEREVSGGRRVRYTLRAAPLGEESLGGVVLEGWFEHQGVDPETGRQLGFGLLRYDYSVLASGPRGERGRGAVGVVSTARGRAHNVFVLDFVPRGAVDRTPMNGRFSFAEVYGQGGGFRFVARGELVADDPGPEVMRQAVRWSATGEARSHLAVTLSGREVRPVIEECWGADRRQTWVRSNPELPEFQADGREGACAFFDRPELPDGSPVLDGEEPGVPGVP